MYEAEVCRNKHFETKSNQLKCFSDDLDFSYSGVTSQVKFMSDLACNGFGHHLSLVNPDNIDPNSSHLDNSRFIMAMTESVGRSFHSKYKSRYLELLKPLESFATLKHSKLTQNLANSILSTDWSFMNDSSFNCMDSQIDALGLTIGSKNGYSYTRLDLENLSKPVAFWLNHFIDQLSFAGAGFNTSTKLARSCDLVSILDYLPESPKDTYIDITQLAVESEEIEPFEDEVLRDEMGFYLRDCLCPCSKFKGDFEAAKSLYYKAIIDSDLDNDQAKELISVSKQYSDICRSYQMEVVSNGRDIYLSSTGEYSTFVQTSITSKLKALIECTPPLVTEADINVVSYLKQVVSMASEVDTADLNHDDISISESRLIHIQPRGFSEGVQDLVHDFETNSLMQLTCGSYTGVEDVSAVEINNLIESESLMAACLNGIYCIVNSKDQAKHISSQLDF
ncbi:hypothetical protein OH460_09015 [Vibrio sp. Makdt]|uniref:hypothetical protein n=1 Tax=Vibrio sp. Makdt TaxID=2998828 RepID=UPI0022CD70CC|nr:hypothetical protein [Vibrio sp. Makdt]MDA0152442.1 hypothetical protein [Vibrio sp. Makdt]